MNIPVLKGWISLPVSARQLAVTRQRIFQMVDEGKLTSIHQIRGAGDRPAAYVVSEAEMCRLRREQLEASLAVERAAGLDADHDQIRMLEGYLATVQLDAVSLLHAQLAATAEAAEVAGQDDLATVLRGMLTTEEKVPVGA